MLDRAIGILGVALGLIDHRNRAEKPNANKFVFEDGPARIVVSKKGLIAVA
jgi:hypothetical protein